MKSEGGRGIAMTHITKSGMEERKIPLPPLSIQEEIVAEVDSYQKIIDGARQVVENYKPRIDIDPAWEVVELGEVTDIISGYAFDSNDFLKENHAKSIKITNVGVREFYKDTSENLPEKFLSKFSRFTVNEGDLVIALTRSIISDGLKVAKVPKEWNNSLVNQRVAGIKAKGTTNINFVYLFLCTEGVYNYVEEKSRSLMQPNLSVVDLKKLPIPLPSIDIQTEVVAKIGIEQDIINSNKQLIQIFEQKIKDRIAKVWGE
jgi:restriction endonuclease S subunit